MPITREDVSGWIDAWNSDQQGTLEDYIRAQVASLGLEDEMVITPGDPTSETHIADLLISDLPSYPNATGSSAQGS